VGVDVCTCDGGEELDEVGRERILGIVVLVPVVP
jgi:hypothetical protein